MQRYLREEDDHLGEVLVPYTPSKIWEVGDTLIFMPQPNEYGHEPVFRKIAEVRPTGYSWYYPEWEFGAPTAGHSENHWWSENSNDQFLEHWQLHSKS